MGISSLTPTHKRFYLFGTIGLICAAIVLAAFLTWQGVTAAGAPDPTVPHTSPLVAVLDIAALVFREGIECVVVLTAVTASLRGANRSYRGPIGMGVVVGMVATLITWFIAVGILSDLTTVVPALSLQAWTGLLAVIVLLVVMNWFFHKVYWTGWISFHNRKKKDLLELAKTPEGSKLAVLWGLGLLGFASFYREGFEVVLFLQSYRLQLGGTVVLYGALVGIIFSGILAFLSFVGNHRVPYKRMLVLTGVLLAMVLFIMVGEQVFEMEQAGWFSAMPISWLKWIPDWAGVWLSIYPDLPTIIAQVIAMALVFGSYFVSRYQAVFLPKKHGAAPYRWREAAPTVEVVGTSLAQGDAREG
ncbi:iron permease [Ktedonosporobacter rubrisoli]|uniref:Iron permease n=1 Tax=Ktedonosporobacter rubrisoli TaxID=2509675 RepID=A0A4P6JKI8_KTERU|nr:FTR1 family protein [Ktedonosporobacter rubrisoli]QBD75482.1 iron permease [Ktedonosporobacter rubrisoli]